MHATTDFAQGPVVALGLLSGMCQFGSPAAGLWVGTEELRMRRERLRRAAAASSSVGTSSGRGAVALHFLMESPDAILPSYMWRCKPRDAEFQARAEARRAGDIIFLNVTRDYFGCGWRYILWFREARRRYPSARYIAAGDDDTYVQFDHLSVELERLARAHRGERVYWGLMIWRAYYNNFTLEPSALWEGWSHKDSAAVRTRRRVEALATCVRHSLGASRGLGRGWQSVESSARACEATQRRAPMAPELAADAARGQIDPATPPFPIANGPLFALSTELASDLIADPLPSAWHERFYQRNPFAVEASAHGRRPRGLNTGLRRRASKSCWPGGDVTLGWWVASIALCRRLNVTLVNSPMGVQHHIWPSSSRPADNRTVVVHKVPHRRHKRTGVDMWAEVASRTSGGFEPSPRRCGLCGEVGWVSWPDSPLARWRCCG